MLIREEESKIKNNGKNCIVIEYEFPYKELGIAVAKINGRYPDKGKAVNIKCDEMYYVISGEAIIYTQEGEFEIKKGDTYYFEKNKWYYVEAKNLEIVLPTAPAWFLDQYEIID